MSKKDFKTKENIRQSIKTWDNFWIKVTPIWFDWMQWILVLGLVGYLVEQTRNIVLFIVYSFSYISFYFYIQGIFYAVDFQGFPFIKSKRAQRGASIILSGIIAIIVWFLISSVISELKGKV